MNDVSGHDENSINTDLTYESGDENVCVPFYPRIFIQSNAYNYEFCLFFVTFFFRTMRQA